MTDDQAIVIAAAIMFKPGEGAAHAFVKLARALFEENRKLGPLPTQALPETRKATLSHSTIQERNEAHAERAYEKRRGA